MEKVMLFMSSQISNAQELINQLYELGFAPSQVNTIILNAAGTVKLDDLPSGKLLKLIRELENCVWFSRRCLSII